LIVNPKALRIAIPLVGVLFFKLAHWALLD
jgi:hypothetical protein